MIHLKSTCQTKIEHLRLSELDYLKQIQELKAVNDYQTWKLERDLREANVKLDQFNRIGSENCVLQGQLDIANGNLKDRALNIEGLEEQIVDLEKRLSFYEEPRTKQYARLDDVVERIKAIKRKPGRPKKNSPTDFSGIDIGGITTPNLKSSKKIVKKKPLKKSKPNTLTSFGGKV